MEYANLKLTEKEGKWYFIDEMLSATHDRKGMRNDLYQKFLDTHGLRESNSSLYPEWGMMIPKEHRPKYRVKNSNHFREIGEMALMSSLVADHGKLLHKGKQYVYTMQPYGLSLDTYQQLESVWGAWGLNIDISYVDAWWYPGSTPLVVISQFPIKLNK